MGHLYNTPSSKESGIIMEEEVESVKTFLVIHDSKDSVFSPDKTEPLCK